MLSLIRMPAGEKRDPLRIGEARERRGAVVACIGGALHEVPATVVMVLAADSAARRRTRQLSRSATSRFRSA